MKTWLLVLKAAGRAKTGSVAGDGAWMAAGGGCGGRGWRRRWGFGFKKMGAVRNADLYRLTREEPPDVPERGGLAQGTLACRPESASCPSFPFHHGCLPEAHHRRCGPPRCVSPVRHREPRRLVAACMQPGAHNALFPHCLPDSLFTAPARSAASQGAATPK